MIFPLKPPCFLGNVQPRLMTLDDFSIAKKSEPQHNLGKIASSVASYQVLLVYDRIVHGSTMVYISWLMYLYVWWYVQVFKCYGSGNVCVQSVQSNVSIPGWRRDSPVTMINHEPWSIVNHKCTMKLTITGSTILQSLSDYHPISSHYDPIISVFKPMFFDVLCFSGCIPWFLVTCYRRCSWVEAEHQKWRNVSGRC